MKNDSEIMLWGEQAVSVIPTNLTEPSEITDFAKQLTFREKTQIVTAYKSGSFELATSFVWGRAMASLKRELATLGITFLAELLGRTDINEDANVLDAITDKEAVKLAEELGVVSRTDAIRLRHAQELVSHFSGRDPNEEDEPMEGTEAINVLLYCVRSVLAKPSIQVAKRFAEFRKELEIETFRAGDSRCETLKTSPYFFQRLAIAVLLSGIRTHTGAKLEHCLANLNLLLPILWSNLRDPERWLVGNAYAQVYADGLQLQTVGIKQALLKVRGFDYVPENFRSQTFLRAAEAIIQAHEGANNFYAEESPTLNLERLGTVIPAPALGTCITALLCVYLGNSYGTCWAAVPIAEKMLKKLTADRWVYYLDKILPGDLRIIDKLQHDRPQQNWFKLAGQVFEADIIIKNKTVNDLVVASLKKDDVRLESAVKKLMLAYYGEGTK
jgi:hypothetical protein